MFLRRLLSWIDVNLDLILLFIKNVISDLSVSCSSDIPYVWGWCLPLQVILRVTWEKSVVHLGDAWHTSLLIHVLSYLAWSCCELWMPPLWDGVCFLDPLCILSFILILLSSCICLSRFSATDVAPLSPCCQSHPRSCKSLCFALCRVFKVVLKQSHSTLVFYFYCDGAYLCYAKSAGGVTL